MKRRASLPGTNAPARAGRTAGFTIVELLVAAVVASILMGAVYQVLVTNQRISVVQREQMAGHQTVRAGLDLLAQELREVSGGGGDLLEAEEDQIAFRALRAQGIACLVGSAVNPVVNVLVPTRPFVAGEPLYLFADDDPETDDDDSWLQATIQDADGGVTCGTDLQPAQELTLTGLDAAQWAQIGAGAQVRSWEEVEYTVQDYSGVSYLVRIQDGDAARLVGPLAAGNGLRFEYLDTDADPTANAGEVRQIRVILRTTSVAQTGSGGSIADSLSTSVHLRN